MTTTQRFQLFANACTNCTSYWLQRTEDQNHETIYILRDGCGDVEGDPFYGLDDLEDFISNNAEVADYITANSF